MDLLSKLMPCCSSRNSEQLSSNNITFQPLIEKESDEELYYKLNSKQRGYCLIFNHFNFDDPEMDERSGTHSDCQKLQFRFGALGFKVKVYDDYKSAEILNSFAEYAAKDHSDSDCFVCCILTHGGRGGILHSKDSTYHLIALLNYFTPNSCPTLEGKPKVFLIQACRGSRLDDGVEVKCQTDGSQSIMHSSLLPTHPDFLVVFSTFPDHFSFRDTLLGSWFIQCLTAVMLEYFDEDIDFLSLVTIANQIISYKYKSKVRGNKLFDDKKQVLNITHTLTKQIVFKRIITSDNHSNNYI